MRLLLIVAVCLISTVASAKPPQNETGSPQELVSPMLVPGPDVSSGYCGVVNNSGEELTVTLTGYNHTGYPLGEGWVEIVPSGGSTYSDIYYQPGYNPDGTLKPAAGGTYCVASWNGKAGDLIMTICFGEDGSGNPTCLDAR